MGLRAGVASDRGLVRPTNEDSFFLREGLYAVCDGMGGARGGEVASQMACLGLLGLNPETAGQRELRDTLDSTNRAIVHRGSDEEHLMGMGTTFTGVLVKSGLMTLAHVGDSRAYLLREGDLEQLSEDHSWVGEMVRRGDLTPAQAAVHPHRNVITRVLGTDGQVQPDIIEKQLVPGDRLLLCSDGLTGMVADTEILELLASGEGPQQTAEMLVKAALAAGGEDNVTVVVIDVTADEGETKPASEASGAASSQILFGPSDRGSLVTASSHRGRMAAGVRERFGRRTAPPARPVARPAPRDIEIDATLAGRTIAEAREAAGTAATAGVPGDEASQGEIERHTEALVSSDEPAAEIAADPDAQDTAVPTEPAGGEPVEPFDLSEQLSPPALVASGEALAAPKPPRAKRTQLRPGQLKLLIVTLALVLALAIAVGGFAFYNSTIYYVGIYSDGTVALYRGLPTSLLGIDFSRVVQLGTVKYETLTPYLQQKVDSHSLVSEEEGQDFLGALNGSL